MINIAIKLATSITYTADGVQTNFSVPFDYLRPSFVHVTINDTDVSGAYTISNRMIMFDSAPPKDSIVYIYRSTPTTRLVSWADASILKAIDMTIAEIQQLHILEEASDWSKTNSIVLDEESGAWQGRNCRMSKVADPTEAQDVVTKHYLDSTKDSFVQQLNNIKTQTEQFSNTAGSSAQSASASAADARNSADEAETYKDNAKTYMDNAKNYSENVNVFTPSVSTSGVLSWTNKAGLDNPPSVNIKGDKGNTGTAATIKVGTVTTGAAGSNASVTNSGTASNAVFDFVLPKGKDGADGGVTVDEELSSTSTNPVQNKTIYNALLGKVGTEDIFNGFALRSPTASIMWRIGSQTLGSLTASNYTGTALRATQDGDGNVITSTYATKTDISGVVKSVNGVQPDTNGNVNITVSGGGTNVTVDKELSESSTNPVQNKVITAALNNRAVLDESNIFTNQNLFTSDINLTVDTVGGGAIKWYRGDMSTMVASLNNNTYTGTADKATKDAAGNVIVDTYAKKTDISVDDTLSATSTKAIANKAVHDALSKKLDTSGTAQYAYMDSRGYVIHERYAAKADVDSALSNKLDSTGTAEAARKDGDGNTISLIYAKKSDVEVDLNNKLNKTDTAVSAKVAEQAFKDGDGNYITSTYVKSVNNVTPDTNGNVSITVSGGGGGVSTSTQNVWTAQQSFDLALLGVEKYKTTYANGNSVKPSSVTAVYNATGSFTLDLTNFSSLLSIGQSLVFTAYIKANADYPLTITNGGTLKYTGNSSDLAITSAGLLLNIFITLDNSGNKTSIVQASKLS